MCQGYDAHLDSKIISSTGVYDNFIVLKVKRDQGHDAVHAKQ